MLTLSKALKNGRLQDFIAQEEARGSVQRSPLLDLRHSSGSNGHLPLSAWAMMRKSERSSLEQTSVTTEDCFGPGIAATRLDDEVSSKLSLRNETRRRVGLASEIRRRYRWGRYQTRFDVYQPSGWNSPIAKKIIDGYWRAMITSLKVLFTILLTIMAFGASWLLWTIIIVAVSH